MTKASVALRTAEPSETCPDTQQHLRLAIRQYLQLAKLGIITGNLISVAGGFFLAARGHVKPWLFLAAMVGVSLVIASGCAFNNVIDRDIDAKMRRTQNRVLVRGLISPRSALIYASLLGLCGIILLGAVANLLSAFLALAGFLIYVGIYSLYMKRHSVFGTVVGSLSGAMPPVIGYCAVTNHFDAAAALLLLTFSLWQMPHSYAIAILHLKDYSAAHIPVLPAVRGIPATKKQIIWYIAAFTGAALLLAAYRYVGYAYVVVTTLISLYWLSMALSGYRTTDDRAWARKMFIFSIVSIMALSFMMSIDFYR